jgi:DNA polymerase-1
MTDKITLVADLETDGLLDTITKVWLLSIGEPREPYTIVSYADQPGYPPLAEGFARLATADRVVMHNGMGFDLWAARVAGFAIRWDSIFDTLIASRMAHPTWRAHALADWGIRLGVPKVEHSEWDKFSPEMVTRCEGDVRITIQVFRKLWPRVRDQLEALELEHMVAVPIALQEANGFRLNVSMAEALTGELRQEQEDAECVLQQTFKPLFVPKLTKGTCLKTPKVGKPEGKGKYVAGCSYGAVEYQVFNPASRPQIEMRLKKEFDWKPSKFTDGGRAQLDETILNDLAVKYPAAAKLSRYFRLSKQLGQLADGDNSWLKLVTPAGRVHGRVNQLGAITGRMSHYKPNMAQVDKKDLRMREVWIPADGWKLVGTDAEGLELRMLGHYLAPYDGGEYGRAVVEGTQEAGTDPHTRVQRAVGLFERDWAKRLMYAYLYGAGNYKLGLIIYEDADSAKKPRPKGAPATLGKAARLNLERGIVGLDQLVYQVKKAHATRGWLRGLDGRRITTRSQHSALNTLLQGAGAIVMKKALALFHFMGTLDGIPSYVSDDRLSTMHFAYCANVHDEVQLEADPNLATDFGKRFAHSITLAGECLGLRVPLGGTFAVGDNWKETH